MAFAAPLLPLLPTLLSAGSAAITGAGAISGGNYQAAVLRNNAKIAEMNAAKINEAGQREAVRSDIDYRTAVAEQLAAQGASGFDILGRSQTAARLVTTKTGRLAAKDIIDESASGARRSLQEAADFRGRAKQAVAQGYLTAAGAALGAGADIMKSGSMLGRRSRVARGTSRGSRPNWYGRGG